MSHHYRYGYDSATQDESTSQVPSQHARPQLGRQISDPSSSTTSPPSIPEHSQYPSQDERYPDYPMYYPDTSVSPSVPYMHTPGGMHFYPPPLGHDQSSSEERPRTGLSLHIPPHTLFAPNSQASMSYMPTPGHVNGPAPASPYATPHGVNSGSANSGQGMTEYFPPFGTSPLPNNRPSSSFSPTWSSNPPATVNSSKGKKDGHSGAKTSRQQFTACGACRHRRVKCDLKDRQEQAEKQAITEDTKGLGPHRSNTAASAAARRRKVSCSNCQERGTNCVDEYAPLKAAKQLRRGKRISEIEMLYGKSAANAAVANNPDDTASDVSRSSTKGTDSEPVLLPDLTKDFFESPFFRRFQIQRPILDPVEFVSRYLRSSSPPSAAALGPEGGILCHVLYAWAVSYGVDETGRLDVPEGGNAPNGPLNLDEPGEGEVKREADRQRRKARMAAVVEVILRQIDDAGLMRKPSWDGVRSLLLILPLTEGVSSSVERLAMYESAISQVFTLCSSIALGYDGTPSGISSIGGSSDEYGEHAVHAVRVRLYWYAFVHEGITTGLKGGRLHLDDEDLEAMQEAIDARAVVMQSSVFRSAARMATAPINLALACRLINKALTGRAAMRRQHVDPLAVKAAWESLEACWEEFDSFRHLSPVQPYSTEDEIVRFSDGWKIFLFEAQNVIRKSLEDRLAKLTLSNSGPSAYIVDPQVDIQAETVNIRHLLDIAKSKCEVKTRQILEIVRFHVGTRFFEWDASLVRDGTYYAAMLHANAGGSDEDIAVCIQALNEMRWAHAKAWERSADLRNELASHRSMHKYQGWEQAQPDANPVYYPYPPVSEHYASNANANNADNTSSLSSSNSPYTSPGNKSTTDQANTSELPSNGMLPPSAPGYVVYPTTSGPPPLTSLLQNVNTAQQGIQQFPGGQSGAGHYVLQPNGSQVYVPYQ